MGLQEFEQRLERLVEGAFAKAFRSGLQPVELGRRLVREMDRERSVGVRSVLAPNQFHIRVSPEDHDRLAPIEHTLITELAEMTRAHAKAEGYRFAGTLGVELHRDGRLTRGSFRVIARMVEGGPTATVLLADGTRVPVGDSDPVTLGRASDCQIVVGDPTVSKHHAELRREGPDVVLVDLRSTNGTRVNGRGIKQHVLVDGDEIGIGTAVLRFETG